MFQKHQRSAKYSKEGLSRQNFNCCKYYIPLYLESKALLVFRDNIESCYYELGIRTWTVWVEIRCLPPPPYPLLIGLVYVVQSLTISICLKKIPIEQLYDKSRRSEVGYTYHFWEEKSSILLRGFSERNKDDRSIYLHQGIWSDPEIHLGICSRNSYKPGFAWLLILIGKVIFSDPC